MVLAALARFGLGAAYVDNWSMGGFAVGVDLEGGTLMGTAHDKWGNTHTHHPDSGIEFAGYSIPEWDAVLDLARRAQAAFPYYPLLGFDIAVTPAGPVLLEINAYPDIVMQEQSSGPLLADRAILAEFIRYDLLYNNAQRSIAAGR